MKQVIVLGGTGYLGKPLIERLLEDRFRVTAVTRPLAVSTLPSGCGIVIGNALDASTYQDHVPAGATFVHLVGTPHPAPWKAAEFRSVDLVSLEQSMAAAKRACAEHFVFVSVAHPAPVMKAFIEIRVRCEREIQESGLPATILRPWYVLGPGHSWPYALLPLYKALELIPATREGALRLGLVTRAQMVQSLVSAISSQQPGFRVLETPEIRSCKAGIRPSHR